MSKLRLIFGDQLSQEISSMNGINSSEDTILMCEIWNEATYVKHHKKKIAFLFSAMRHFARELRASGYKVDYIKLNDKNNTGYFKTEVERAIKRHNINHIVVTHPGEYRVLKDIECWEQELGISVTIREDDRFLCTIEEFSKWAKDKKQLRMENFYREMRKKHSILMNGADPVGGKWNYDAENRQPPKSELKIPKPYSNTADVISQEVMDMVLEHFSDHFGDLHPFYFAVTRDQALQSLELFIEQRLEDFGTFQDAMIEGEPWMYHSHIGFYLNCGLLLPLECVKAAEKAYDQKKVPLNSVEGFIRQIIGWREYIRGIYWLKMPDYARKNFFGAKRNLPDFYWTADTKMNCIHQCVLETKKHAYAHHIQRLMVLGNFALISGIDPVQVNEWFLTVYADADAWVELPNVSGMVLFADGGYLASKPYAAGANYINKMSDYCKNCSYEVKKKNGPKACPFNYLYWDFLARNRNQLKTNHRVSMMYKTYDRMDEDKKNAIRHDSQLLFDALSS